MCLCRYRSPLHVWVVMTSMIDLLLIAIRSVQALSFSKLSHTEMETWAMVILALVSVYGLVRCIHDVRDYLGTRATPPTRNTKTKQCQGPTTYTGIRNHTKPKYEVLKEREFDAWGETIW